VAAVRPPGFDAGSPASSARCGPGAEGAGAGAVPDALTDEQAEAVLACCRRPRDQFLVILLRDTGLRIGEALGLRGEDMHLLPDSRALGCTVVGAHVHVRHRANPNGALAKSVSRGPSRPATRCSPLTLTTSLSGPGWPARRH